MRAARPEHLLWAIYYLKQYTTEREWQTSADAMKICFANGQQQFLTALLAWKMKLYVPKMFWKCSLLCFANVLFHFCLNFDSNFLLDYLGESEGWGYRKKLFSHS